MFRHTLARARSVAISILVMSVLALVVTFGSGPPDGRPALFWLVLAGFALQAGAAALWLRHLHSAPPQRQSATSK